MPSPLDELCSVVPFIKLEEASDHGYPPLLEPETQGEELERIEYSFDDTGPSLACLS
jgi:hypothetical protein